MGVPKWGVEEAWAGGLVGGPVGGPARGPWFRKAPRLARASEAPVTRTHRPPATSAREDRIAPVCAQAYKTPNPCRIRRTDVQLLSRTPPERRKHIFLLGCLQINIIIMML